MEKDDDAPEDVKRATSVERAIKKGEKDDTFEGYPRVKGRKQKWEHCEKMSSKKPKQKAGTNGDCCREKKERMKRKESKLVKVSVFGEPCTFPKRDIVPRHCLSKEEYIDMLATGSRKCPSPCEKMDVFRKLRPISPRIKELAQPTRQRMLITLQEGVTKLPAALLDNLVKTLENETCLTPEQAATASRRKKSEKGKKTRREKSHRGKSKETRMPKRAAAITAHAGMLDRDSVSCQFLMAERFVKSILKWKSEIPRSEFSDIARVIIKRLTYTLEYSPTQQEDRKTQQLRLLADVIASWISGVLSEVARDQEQELEERCKKKLEEMEAQEEDDDEEDSEDDRSKRGGGRYGDRDVSSDGEYDDALERFSSKEIRQGKVVEKERGDVKGKGGEKLEEGGDGEERDVDEGGERDVDGDVQKTGGTAGDGRADVDRAEDGGDAGVKDAREITGETEAAGGETATTGGEVTTTGETVTTEADAQLPDDGTGTAQALSDQPAGEREIGQPGSPEQSAKPDEKIESALEEKDKGTAEDVFVDALGEPAPEEKSKEGPDTTPEVGGGTGEPQLQAAQAEPAEAQETKKQDEARREDEPAEGAAPPIRTEGGERRDDGEDGQAGAVAVEGRKSEEKIGKLVDTQTSEATRTEDRAVGAVEKSQAEVELQADAARVDQMVGVPVETVDASQTAGVEVAAVETQADELPSKLVEPEVPEAQSEKEAEVAKAQSEKEAEVAKAQSEKEPEMAKAQSEKEPEVAKAQSEKEPEVPESQRKKEPEAAHKDLAEDAPVFEKFDDLFKTDLPFLTVGKIIDAVYKMVENTAENDGKDPITNGIHRAIYEKLSSIVALENPKLLTEELKDVMDVVCGKIAIWLKTVLSKSEMAFLNKYVPEVESKDVRDWTRWLANISDGAAGWLLWIREVLDQIKVMQGVEVTRGEWHDWTRAVDSAALLWRRFHLQTIHQAHHNVTMITDKRVVKTGTKENALNSSEQLIRTLDLHA